MLHTDLAGKNVVVYDCEIVEEIGGPKGITWNDHDKMGLSVACLYDYLTDDYLVFLAPAIGELVERLNNADLVVGFNTVGFDHKLLHAQTGKMRKDLMDPLCPNNFDMLYWSRRSVGWRGPQDRFPAGMKLDNHLEATFGKEHMKTGHGEMAPKWWQQGLHSRVISYCLADVKRERMLFEHIVRHGYVKTAAHGERNIDLTVVWNACRPKPTPTPEVSV